MYIQRFDLDRLPFENVPDPKFFFDNGQKSHALYEIINAIDCGRGLIVVTGPIGSGKTMISQMVMNEYEDRFKVIWLAEPPETGKQLLAFIASELGISDHSEIRVVAIDIIRTKLLSMNSGCLLIIDEAQNLDAELATTIKLLNNLELKSRKLIQILLLGQDELLAFIDRPQMASFKQRIAALKVLGRMDRWEIKRYIEFRLEKAGSVRNILTDSAIEAIALGSSGIPRLINTLSNNTLECAAIKDKVEADIEDVYDAAQGLVDRKAIFQMMLSVRNSNAVQDDGGKQTEEEAFQSAVEGFADWQLVQPNRNSLVQPLIYLVLSLILLAFSLYTFTTRRTLSLDVILGFAIG